MRHPAQIESQIPPNNLISCHYLSQIRCQSSASGIGNQSLARIWHVFPLIFLLLEQPRGEASWFEHLNSPRWLSHGRVYVFIYVNIMLMCFPPCRSSPIAPFQSDVRWLMRPWCDGAEASECSQAGLRALVIAGLKAFLIHKTLRRCFQLCVMDWLGLMSKLESHLHGILRGKKLDLIKWNWRTLLKSYFELYMQIKHTANRAVSFS